MSDDLEQTPEELQAHFGPAGPIQAATQFLESMLQQRDYAAAWRLMDPDFRRRRAEQWVEANAQHSMIVGRDLDQLVEELTMIESTSDLWPTFAGIELSTFVSAWSNVDLETWGWASRPRPIAPGYEVALFIPTEGTVRVVTESTLVHGLPLVMHYTECGWLFAGQQGDERWAPDIPPT
jgi:hypothetical protein